MPKVLKSYPYFVYLTATTSLCHTHLFLMAVALSLTVAVVLAPLIYTCIGVFEGASWSDALAATYHTFAVALPFDVVNLILHLVHIFSVDNVLKIAVAFGQLLFVLSITS